MNFSNQRRKTTMSELKERRPIQAERQRQELRVGYMTDGPSISLDTKKTLDMARRLVESGNTYQALGLYGRVMNEFPGTREATEAKTWIARIAFGLESEGQHYLAAVLYRSVLT
jgi:hypothetical protein